MCVFTGIALSGTASREAVLMSHLRNWTAALAASLALIGGIVFTAGPAAAAAPGNDTQAGAVTITSLPFHYTEDTTEATVDASESVASDLCLSFGAPKFEHAVWFKATIPAGVTQAIRVDTTLSDYSTGIAVLADNGGTLSALDCVPGTYSSPGPPPEGTYYLVIFGDGFLTEATSGNLDLSVDVAPPPPDVAMTIAPTGTATKEGGVWISGTVTCTGANAVVADIEGTVSQTVGRLIISSDFLLFPDIPCDGVSYPWRAYAPPTNGKFSGGKAVTVSSAFGCNDAECSSAYAQATVKLNHRPSR